MTDESVVAAADHTSNAKRSRVLLAAAGAVILVLVLVAVLAVWRSGPSSSAADTGDAPHFVDDTTGSGIDHSYEGAYEHFVGGGVAAFDCDDNGLDDLYFAGGTEPAALYRNRSEVGGALRFEQLASSVTDLTAVTGAYPLDVDSDELMDLVVLRRGANVVLRGLGDCGFEDATEQFGLDGGDDWTTAFSATWEGTNALPTLAFGNYRTLDETACADSRDRRPNSAGDGYDTPMVLTPGYCTLSMLYSDWDRSGRRDLRVSNDRNYYVDGREQLWRDRARGATTRVHRGRRLAAAADLGHGHRQSGSDRRRLPGGVPHQPGRQQAPDTRERSRPADVQGHGTQGRCHGTTSVRGR